MSSRTSSDDDFDYEGEDEALFYESFEELPDPTENVGRSQTHVAGPSILTTAEIHNEQGESSSESGSSHWDHIDGDVDFRRRRKTPSEPMSRRADSEPMSRHSSRPTNRPADGELGTDRLLLRERNEFFLSEARRNHGKIADPVLGSNSSVEPSKNEGGQPRMARAHCSNRRDSSEPVNDWEIPEVVPNRSRENFHYWAAAPGTGITEQGYKETSAYKINHRVREGTPELDECVLIDGRRDSRPSTGVHWAAEEPVDSRTPSGTRREGRPSAGAHLTVREPAESRSLGGNRWEDQLSTGDHEPREKPVSRGLSSEDRRDACVGVTYNSERAKVRNVYGQGPNERKAVGPEKSESPLQYCHSGWKS